MALEPILYRSEEAVFDKTGLERVKVTAKVVAHVRGEKLRVFKFKPKRGYKRRTGHRQDLTQIEVTEIALAGAGRADAKAAAAPPAESKAPAAKASEPSAAKAKPAGEKAAKPSTRASSGSAPVKAADKSAESPEEAEARWLIRRGSGRAATGGTQTRSGWA